MQPLRDQSQLQGDNNQLRSQAPGYQHLILSFFSLSLFSSQCLEECTYLFIFWQGGNATFTFFGGVWRTTSRCCISSFPKKRYLHPIFPRHEPSHEVQYGVVGCLNFNFRTPTLLTSNKEDLYSQTHSMARTCACSPLLYPRVSFIIK